jgi:hypothetical protein
MGTIGRHWVAAGLAVGLALGLLLAGSAAEAGTKAKKGKLVVLEHERWLDTLKGTVKNFGTVAARDVTVVVRFADKRKKPLGTQRVSVGDLRGGEQAAFSLAVEERNRPATHYQFEAHAIWP